MTIISMSINDKLLEDLEKAKKGLGFSGRSEVIRAALRSFVSDYKSKEVIEGNVGGALVVIHNEADIEKLKHDFSSVIKTQVHNHIEDKCLELFVVSGDGKKVNKLVSELKKIDKVSSVNFIGN